MQMDSLDIIGIAISVMAIVIVLSFWKDKSYLEWIIIFGVTALSVFNTIKIDKPIVKSNRQEIKRVLFYFVFQKGWPTSFRWSSL
jgi:hypothetical protein